MLGARVRGRQGLDTRAAGRVQVLLRNGARIRGANEVVQHFLAHLAAVVLAHDLLRYLARPEPLQFRRSPDFDEARIDLALDIDRRHTDRHAPLEAVRGLHFGLVTL